MLFREPDSLRTAIHVVPAGPPALAAITRRIKAELDTAGILNLDRLFLGL